MIGMAFTNIYFSLGSNLGDREKNISEALRLMDEAFGRHYVALSKLIETEPAGFSGGKFLNAAVLYRLPGNLNIADVTTLIDYLLSGSWPEPVYTVVGTPNLFESEWDLNDERNNMTKGADGIYRLNKAGYFPEGTEIYFRIVCNHTYAYSWPAEERLIYIYETGAFSIDIIFDPNAPDNQKINVDMNKIF